MSVGIPTDYSLDGNEIGVRFLARAINVPALYGVQIGSQAHKIFFPQYVNGAFTYHEGVFFLLICTVGLWVLRPLLTYCTSPA
jgi:hypothetical protein